MMNNRQNNLPNSQWNRYQSPTSPNFPTNTLNNIFFVEANVWRPSQNANNSTNHHRHINEANYPNSNVQVSRSRIYPHSIQNSPNNTAVHSRNNIQDFGQMNLQQTRFTSNHGENLRMPLQNVPNLRLPQTGESNSNYSCGVISQSISNGSHNSVIHNTSNMHLLLNRAYNQSVNSASSSQRPSSYQNNISQTSTVTNSVGHQTINPMNHFNVPFNVPPPPINNSRNNTPVIFNQSENSQLPRLPFSIPSCHPNNSLTYELPLNTQIAPPVQFPNPPPIMPPVLRPIVPKAEENTLMCAAVSPDVEVEQKLSKFLNSIIPLGKAITPQNISVTKFREVLKEALVTMKNLLICRENLVQLLKSDRDTWNSEVNQAFFFQHQLDNICNLLHRPGYLTFVKNKLKSYEKKKIKKKRLNQEKINNKLKQLKKREELHQEIDKWLDSIKEKNLKLKREAEMKKEADSILSEVRRKIHEARRTIEKIKLLEKLRNARQAKAINKGLFLPEHDEKFQNNISKLREIMLRQLSDYEAEEKALKVMLEAEQEGQLEEEALWKIKKLRSLQKKRQSNIIECLFGDTVEEPVKGDPIFLFYQFHNSGNKSIESLSQIRHQWDMHVNESGDSIPQQWVVPVPPSSSTWEAVLKS